MTEWAKPAREAADALLDRPAAALPEALALADRIRAAGDAEALTIILRSAAWAARELFDHQAALDHLAECVEVAAAAGLDGRVVEALITRSATNLELGRTEAATADVARAKAMGAPGTEAEVAFAEGLVADTAGDLWRCVAAYEQAAAAANDDQLLAVKAHNNLGLARAGLGQLAAAESALVEARRLAEPLGDGVLVHVAGSQAVVAAERGRPAESLARFEEVRAISRRAGLPLAELHRDMTTALSSMFLLEEAADAARRAVTDARVEQQGDLQLAEALVPQADLALLRGELDEAVTVATEAAALFASQDRPGFAARAELVTARARLARDDPLDDVVDQLTDVEARLATAGWGAEAVTAAMTLGRAEDRRGRTTAARAAWRRAAHRATAPTALVRLARHEALARAARSDDDDRGCLRHCAEGLAALAGLRGAVGSPELRIRLAAHGTELAELALSVAAAGGDARAVWAWVERARGQATALAPAARDMAPRPQGAPGGSRGDGGVARDLAEVRALERRVAMEPPGPVTDRLLERLARAERAVRERQWRRTADPSTGVERVDEASLEEVAAELDDAALLSIAVVDGEALAVVVDRGGPRMIDLGPATVVSAAGERVATGLARMTGSPSARMRQRTRAAVEDAVEALARTVWAPLRLRLDTVRELVISPPTTWMALPWSALGGMAGVPIRLVPSASEWLRSRARAPASDRVVVAAGPGLAGAEEETTAVAALHPGAVHLDADAATCERVVEAADGAALVHLACHGRLRTDSPTFSSVALADGPLTVHDVAAMTRPAHHWVLAACELGHPGQPVGPGLEGMVSALLAGGAGAVVAATGTLPDAVATQAMISLHRQLAAGRSLASALWTARHDLDQGTIEGYAAGLMLSCYGGG